MGQAQQTPSWNRDTKRLVSIIMLIAAVGLIFMARSMLSLVVLAAVLAFLVQPLANWLEQRGIPRGLAAAICLLLLVALVAIAPLLIVPALVNGVSDILDALGRMPQLFQNWLPGFLERSPRAIIGPVEIDIAQALGQVQSLVSQAVQEIEFPSLSDMIGFTLEGVKTASGILNTAAGLLSDVVSTIGGAFIAVVLLLMYTFFLTKDGPGLQSWMRSLAQPEFRPEWDELFSRLNVTWQNFFRGQIILSVSIGVVTFIAALALGLPAAFVLGLLAGVLEVVPNLGPVLAAVPAVLLALVDGSSIWPVNNGIFALIVIGVYVLIQQVENNFFVPRIMGQSLNLHPMVVLLGVVVGTTTAGVLGAFLAAPMLASLKVLGLYAHAKLTDRNPFPPAEESPPQIEAPDILDRVKSAVLDGDGKTADSQRDAPEPDRGETTTAPPPAEDAAGQSQELPA